MILRHVVVDLTVIIEVLQVGLPFADDVHLEITHAHFGIRRLQVQLQLQPAHVLLVAESWPVEHRRQRTILASCSLDQDSSLLDLIRSVILEAATAGLRSIHLVGRRTNREECWST